jgi:glycosyltransferase 2 family protein
LDHAALQSYASQAAGAPVPRLEAVTAVGPDAAALAYARIEGMTFSELGGALTDKDLESAWRAIRTLHDADISHRALHAEHLLRDPNGGVWLLDPEEGSIGAGDVAERLDLAELLCTLAMLTDPDRAVASGRRVLGNARLAKALPVLQPVALTAVTRRAIKRRKDVLVTLRESLEELSPDGPVEAINVERLRPRTILTVIAGTVAAYILLIQLGQIDLVTLVTQANWWIAGIALLLSAATYVGAAMSVEGFVPERLNFLRTMQAQLAASFATLVSPPTLGAVGVNVRYLQRNGVHPALAAASIGVSQIMAFVMHLLLVIGFGVIAGTQQDLSVSPPAWAVVIGVIFVVVLVSVFFIPWTRRWAQQRVRPILSQVGPRLLTLAQTPSKLITGIGGFLVLNLGYCLCLLACVRAFGGGGEWAAICVVYLVGATVGQVAPTPGGLGAVEAALTAGLAGVGVDGGIALSAVLLFRIFTFWLPTIPGWFSFNDLIKRGML